MALEILDTTVSQRWVKNVFEHTPVVLLVVLAIKKYIFFVLDGI